MARKPYVSRFVGQIRWTMDVQPLFGHACAPYNPAPGRATGQEIPVSISIGHHMENAIRNAIIKFEQEFMGRGPDEVRAFIVKDLVVVRLKGVLTPAERQLAKTVEGIDMVKRLRQNLIALGRDKLCEQVSEITGAKTLALFTDIDVQIGERVFVFTVDRDIHLIAR